VHKKNSSRKERKKSEQKMAHQKRNSKTSSSMGASSSNALDEKETNPEVTGSMSIYIFRKLIAHLSLSVPLIFSPPPLTSSSLFVVLQDSFFLLMTHINARDILNRGIPFCSIFIVHKFLARCNLSPKQNCIQVTQPCDENPSFFRVCALSSGVRFLTHAFAAAAAACQKGKALSARQFVSPFSYSLSLSPHLMCLCHTCTNSRESGRIGQNRKGNQKSIYYKLKFIAILFVLQVTNNNQSIIIKFTN
jgi:hypothetical protein